MNSRILTISIGACLLAASTYASAATSEKEGWYLGAGIGYSHNKVSNFDFAEDREQKNSATGIKLYGGYQFDNIWAVEFEYVDFGKFTSKSTANQYSLSNSGFGVSGIGNLPLSEEFSVFGKLGAFTKLSTEKFSSTDGSDYQQQKTVSIVPMLGFGAEYHFTQNVSLRAEYEYFGASKVKDSDIKLSNDLLSFSVRYNF